MIVKVVQRSKLNYADYNNMFIPIWHFVFARVEFSNDYYTLQVSCANIFMFLPYFDNNRNKN